MDCKIVNVFEFDCHLIAQVEHYHVDGSFWFLENYRWQGRAGLVRKRMTNARGEVLMDNGEVAPTRHEGGDEPKLEPYLPDGREWARHTTPAMDEESILGIMRDTHQRRLITGWPQGTVDVVGRIPDSKIAQRDRDGCSQLVDKFAYLVGRELTL